MTTYTYIMECYAMIFTEGQCEDRDEHTEYTHRHRGVGLRYTRMVLNIIFQGHISPFRPNVIHQRRIVFTPQCVYTGIRPTKQQQQQRIKTRINQPQQFREIRLRND